jgi:SAM-dependent methyltransferase
VLKRPLAHPLTRGLDIDDPLTTERRRAIVRGKPFLRKLYVEWYGQIREALPEGNSPVLELGSGPGFLDEVLPDLVTSDVLRVPGLSLVLDAVNLPFLAGSLRGIVMVDVFHHIPDVERFLADAARCVRPGGALVMIEPWVTPWSRIVWGPLHHEPFEPDTRTWTLPEGGPLSISNQALPWIVFERDRRRFEARFPSWEIAGIRPGLPLRYLLAGGVSLRSLMPGWSFAAWRGLEAALDRWSSTLGTFARIVLSRRS